jgi:hypothetical protein
MAISSVSKDFIVKHGLVVNTTATFLSTATTDSPYTGALTVAGGVGIADDLQVGGTIYGNLAGTATIARSVIVQSTATTSTYFPVFVEANADPAQALAEYTTSSFSINLGTGIVSIPQLLTNFADISTATISLPLNTESPQTGALVVAGGVGVGYDVHVGGKIFTDGITSSGTVTLSGVGLTTPRYTVKIDSGGPGAKLAIRTSANPTYGIFTAVLDDNETGGASYRIGASEFKVGILDDTTGAPVGSQWAFEITTASNVIVHSDQNSVSTTTGALVVAGGVGIGGDLHVGGGIYSNGVPILTTSTVVNQFLAGDDILINLTTASGVLTINDVATLQSVTSRGNSTNNAIDISNTASSTNLVTGALTVAGGVGVGGRLNAQGLYSYSNGEVGVYSQASTNYVGFKSSATLTATTVWTLPATDGLTGQFLSTDGAKKLSWRDPGDPAVAAFPTGDYGLDEPYPAPLSLVDAFGVSLADTYSCMDPSGRIIEVDLGVLT